MKALETCASTKSLGSQLASFKQFSPAINFLLPLCEFELCKYSAPKSDMEWDKLGDFVEIWCF